MQENTKKGKTSFFNGTEGIRKMQKGDFAFLVDVATAYRIIEVLKFKTPLQYRQQSVNLIRGGNNSDNELEHSIIQNCNPA